MNITEIIKEEFYNKSPTLLRIFTVCMIIRKNLNEDKLKNPKSVFHTVLRILVEDGKLSMTKASEISLQYEENTNIINDFEEIITDISNNPHKINKNWDKKNEIVNKCFPCKNKKSN